MMNRKFYHGDLVPADLAQALIVEFDRGTLRAQTLGQGDGLAVQIATRPGRSAGGHTALTVTIQKAPDGVQVELGDQEWLGTAASLGSATIAALMNPWNLVSRLGDIAEDVENIQLSDRVWQVIDRAMRALGASQQLSERLSRVKCEYCGSANPVGEAACLACGAPLGSVQPDTCPHCGFAILAAEIRCPNCGQPLK